MVINNKIYFLYCPPDGAAFGGKSGAKPAITLPFTNNLHGSTLRRVNSLRSDNTRL